MSYRAVEIPDLVQKPVQYRYYIIVSIPLFFLLVYRYRYSTPILHVLLYWCL